MIGEIMTIHLLFQSDTCYKLKKNLKIYKQINQNMKQTLLILVSTLVLSSCKTFLTIPNYVSSKELASLTIGSTKNQVKTNLGNTSPFDILAGWSQGCEVHHYKYKQTQKELFPSEEDLESGLTNGRKLYPNKDANAYLVYKNGKLNSLYTVIGKAELEQLLKETSRT